MKKKSADKANEQRSSLPAVVVDAVPAAVTAALPLEQAQITVLVEGRHNDPFALLGYHAGDAAMAQADVIRTFQATARKIEVVDKEGNRYEMQCLHDAGLFEVSAAGLPGDYVLDVQYEHAQHLVFDAYNYQSLLGEMDHYLLREGSHVELYKKLGSHSLAIDGVDGVLFSVWAPNASLCSVIGDFNFWDERRHVMRKHHESGIWEIFVPDAKPGSRYKYAVYDHSGARLEDKHDPYAQAFESPPSNAAIVFQSDFNWSDSDWLEQRRNNLLLDEAVSIYEVHVLSWRRHDTGESYSYRELVEHLIPYAVDNGFTHLELMPVTEHPFAGSWGYQPIGLFAPTYRLGTADDLRFFIDSCHSAGLGVIMDWVPAHFPGDAHGLAQFDGTHLYEHADPRQGKHKDWDTLIYNFGRREVSNYLLCNALFWIREFHLDGLRVDAVASMLYLDYSREDGEWIPNEFGGNHNLEAVQFIQSLNTLLHNEGAITLAEESTSWDGVTRPVFSDGLGFTYKWNMGWMNDILEYMSLDPVHRKHHHSKLTFGLMYAFSENFVLPFSHDEVVYGKYSLLEKMPGDDWQKHANLRCLYGLMFAYPGKKLLFMGSEFAQSPEWSHDGQLDWQALGQPNKLQMLQLVSNLNSLYRAEPALHRGDCDQQGFQWIDCDDADSSVIAFYRRIPGSPESIVVICNFTPVVHENYAIGVYEEGHYQEVLNTDNLCFGGSGVVNSEPLQSYPESVQNKPHKLIARVPPLGVLFLKRLH